MSGKDYHLALIDLRNTPSDDQIRSPAQRLVDTPTTEALLKPKVPEPKIMQEKLHYQQKQKHYYGRDTRELPLNLKPNEAVRLQTPNPKPAQYIDLHETSRSHFIKSGEQGRHYMRNRRMLLQTRETPHKIHDRYSMLHRINDEQPATGDVPLRSPMRHKSVQPSFTLTTQTRSERQIQKPIWMNVNVYFITVYTVFVQCYDISVFS